MAQFARLVAQTLLPRSRLVLVTVVAANLIVGAGLYLHSKNVAQPVPSSPLPSLGAEIQLLTEVGEVPSAPPPPVRECRVWGPSEDPAGFDELRKRLVAAGAFPELRETRIDGAPDYLVVVENLGSQDAVRRATQELNGLGIETYVMNRNDGLAISVGLFSRLSGAEDQRSRTAELGYDVDIKTLSREKTVYELAGHVEVESADYKTSTRACAAIAQSS